VIVKPVKKRDNTTYTPIAFRIESVTTLFSAPLEGIKTRSEEKIAFCIEDQPQQENGKMYLLLADLLANALSQQRPRFSSTVNLLSFPPGYLSGAFVANQPLCQFRLGFSCWYLINPPFDNPKALLTRTATSEETLVQQANQTHENDSPFYPLMECRGCSHVSLKLIDVSGHWMQIFRFSLIFTVAEVLAIIF
jgi:hypothetical protein